MECCLHTCPFNTYYDVIFFALKYYILITFDMLEIFSYYFLHPTKGAVLRYTSSVEK